LTADNNQFRFREVVFFGRDIGEYVSMFDLDLGAIRGMRVLDCPAGPAAFAKQAEEIGISVVACDPMYVQEDVAILRQVVDSDAQDVTRKQHLNRDLFHPQLTPTSVRREAMEIFLQDYAEGRERGRYVAGQLPSLPFGDKSFDIALSANLLFLYSDTNSGGMLENSPFDLDFHRKAIRELTRVSRNEVRMYPLKGPWKGDHAFIRPLIWELESDSFKVEFKDVAQRDIIGAEQMMIITRP